MSVGDTMIWIAAVLGALVTIFTVLRPVAKAAWRIYHELAPNGGNSLRDCIDRIETRQVVAEQRAWVFFGSLKEALFEADANGQCLRTSHGFNALTRTTTEDNIGAGWLNTVIEEDRDRVADAWADAIRDGRNFSMRFRMTCGPVYFRATALRCQSEEIQGYAAVVYLPENVTV